MLVTVIPWNGDGPPNEIEIARHMRTEGLVPSGWSNEPGDRYGVHSHDYHKVLYCVSGSIRFTLPDEGPDAGVDLVPGDRLDLPARTRHGAVVGPHGCDCIEAPRW